MSHTRDIASFCEQRPYRGRYWKYQVPKGRYGGKYVGSTLFDPPDRRSGTSHMTLPDGGVVCVGHDVPFELSASMSIEVINAWTANLNKIVDMRRSA